MNWVAWLFVIYAIGVMSTLIFNVMILVYISNPVAILRNALLWPFFLPILIAAWWEEG